MNLENLFVSDAEQNRVFYFWRGYVMAVEYLNPSVLEQHFWLSIKVVIVFLLDCKLD